MVHSILNDQVSDVVTKYGLSERAARNSLPDSPWDMLEKMLENVWGLDNPDGLVFLGVAENPFLHEEVATYIMNNLRVTPKDHLGYGVGPRGSPRLKKALVSFFNSEFRACEPVLEREFLVLPGVVAVTDALAWSICNEGEGIIVPLPYYTGFKPAVGERSRGVLVHASFQSVEGYKSIDDIFDPEINRKALESSLLQASRDGIRVRAVMLSNPHNPLGRCYPVATLRQIASFCGRNDLHLIIDQIFAKSVYDNPKASKVEPFTSILSLDLRGCIDPHFVHIAYGMGKDFCATGLRLGVLHSRNERLVKAMSSICVFGWVPYITQDIWAKMLEDEAFLTSFMEKNRKALAEHCTILTTFLEQHRIPYYNNVNAGVFIWVDLRRYLCSEPLGDGIADLSVNKLSPSDLEMYRGREISLFKRCLESGVGISLGSSFSTEELGWFRISFNAEKRALHIGLQRLLKCLQSIEVDAWKLSSEGVDHDLRNV